MNGNIINPEISKSIDEIKGTQEAFNEAVNKAAKASPDVKEGMCTEEDEKMEPGVILFNAISETTIKILQSPTVTESFNILSKELSKEAVSSLVNLLAITMTNSAYDAVTFYDDLLKGELARNFTIMGDQINKVTAETMAHKSLIEVLQRRIGEVDNNNKVEEFKKSTGLDDKQ